MSVCVWERFNGWVWGQALQEPYGNSPLLSSNNSSLWRQAALVNTTGETLHLASDPVLN